MCPRKTRISPLGTSVKDRARLRTKSCPLGLGLFVVLGDEMDLIFFTKYKLASLNLVFEKCLRVYGKTYRKSQRKE